MSSYAIMRCKKLSSMGSVASSLKHAYRERETPNADSSRTPDNEHRAASTTDEAMGKLRELLPEKRRKDAVLAVEYVLTASPEWWKQASQADQVKFFDQAQRWLAEKYGADRIVTASIHRDETSPHMTAFVVPLTKDGRLSAKEFIGNKAQMTRDQTTFAAAVQGLGLHRGIEGSKARHTRIQAFYEALEQPEIGHKTLTPELVTARTTKAQGIAGMVGMGKTETPQEVASRLTASMRAAYDPAITAAAGAREMRRKAIQAQETALDLRERLKPVLEALQPLTEANRELTRSCSTHGQHWPRLGGMPAGSSGRRSRGQQLGRPSARTARSQRTWPRRFASIPPFGRIRPAMPKSRPGYRRRPQPGSSSTKPSTARMGQAWGARRPATPAPGLAGHPGQCQAPWLQ